MEPSGELRPYSGHRLQRRKRVGQTYVERVHDRDQAGTRTYAYNSLGFRGPEYDPGAALTVFTFGESDAFGTGLELEQTWPSQVVARLAQARGLVPEQVCHLNFAESGASNATIARAVLTQCGAVRPDLVLVNFADFERTEGAAAGQAFPVGPWVRGPEADRAVREADNREGLRERLTDQVRRARHWLDFAGREQGLLESLREILLVQHTLDAWGVRGVAVHRDTGFLDRAEVAEHPLLGPLAALVRRDFLLGASLPHVLDGEHASEDGEHFDPEAHAALGEQVAAVLLGERAPEELARASGRRRVGELVRGFYGQLPFNFYGDLQGAEASVRHNVVEATYPDLHALLAGGGVRRVLEVGCGAGWLANSLALHYGVEVEALDFCPQALERARALAERLGQGDRVRCVERDLFEHRADPPFDLVVTLGVLHHTGDTAGALRHVLGLARPDGHVYVGLYHEPGRRVFLGKLHGLLETRGEAAAARAYSELDHARRKDRRLLDSWFRDQVLHPHETQHTLREVVDWTAGTPFRLRSTSINRFAPLDDDLEALFAQELAYEDRARHVLEVEQRYFPGFFTALLRGEG